MSEDRRKLLVLSLGTCMGQNDDEFLGLVALSPEEVAKGDLDGETSFATLYSRAGYYSKKAAKRMPGSAGALYEVEGTESSITPATAVYKGRWAHPWLAEFETLERAKKQVALGRKQAKADRSLLEESLLPVRVVMRRQVGQNRDQLLAWVVKFICS